MAMFGVREASGLKWGTIMKPPFRALSGLLLIFAGCLTLGRVDEATLAMDVRETK